MNAHVDCKESADDLRRRLARRGGIKRISASVYDEARQALKARLTSVSLNYPLRIPESLLMFVQILHQVVAVLESGGRKTVTVSDVIFVLNHVGFPMGVGIQTLTL